MKVPQGKTVYVRGRKFSAGTDIPDEMAPQGLKDGFSKPKASRDRKPQPEGDKPAKP